MKFETALLDRLAKIMRKDTSSAFSADLHSNEAIREAIDSLDISSSVNVTSISGTAVSGPADLKADVSHLSTAAALIAHDGKLDQVKAKTDALPTGPADEATLTAIKGTGWVDESLKHIHDDIAGISPGTCEAATALAAYDPPTKTELDSAISPLALEATLTEIKGAGWTNETLKSIKDAIGGSSSSAGLTAPQKALLYAEPYSAYPLIETWAGTKASETVEDNNSMSTAQRTFWNSRYPGAVTWAKRCGTNCSVSTGPYMTRLSVNSNWSRSTVIAFRPFPVSWYQNGSYAPHDERIVFEVLMRYLTSSGTGTYARFFAGIANLDPGADFTSTSVCDANYGTNSHSATKRVGFAAHSLGVTSAYGCCSSGAGSAISSAASLGSSINHLKLVWDIGTGITYYLNGVSMGTVVNHMPSSGSADVLFYPFAYCETYSGESWALLDIYGMRCYFQNGA